MKNDFGVYYWDRQDQRLRMIVGHAVDSIENIFIDGVKYVLADDGESLFPVTLFLIAERCASGWFARVRGANVPVKELPVEYGSVYMVRPTRAQVIEDLKAEIRRLGFDGEIAE